MNAVVNALGTANPERYVTGKEVFDFFDRFYDLEPAERELYEKLLLGSSNKGRFVAIEHDLLEKEADLDKLSAEFEVKGRQLVCRAVERALEKSHTSKDEIAAVVVNTCTGYLCPGLSSYLIGDLNLSEQVENYDLMGMGCGAAVPNFRMACDIANRLDRKVLSVSVEICSATLFRGPHPELVVSNCIFGDGAAAAIISNDNKDKALFKLLDFEAGLFPKYRENIRYRTERNRLRNVLSVKVPAIAGKTIVNLSERLLSRWGLNSGNIDFWAVHPGGTAVLDAVSEKMGLHKEKLSASYKVFERYGNMSSASVVFVLEEILKQQAPKPGQLGLIVTFGAGFSAYAALIKFL